ncbi:hypothetical protein LA080_009445 [Diaporthe eres]|nr:hypothetical protein LA080_009445 [Diaporthe eres]
MCDDNLAHWRRRLTLYELTSCGSFLTLGGMMYILLSKLARLQLSKPIQYGAETPPKNMYGMGPEFALVD